VYYVNLHVRVFSYVNIPAKVLNVMPGFILKVFEIIISIPIVYYKFHPLQSKKSIIKRTNIVYIGHLDYNRANRSKISIF